MSGRRYSRTADEQYNRDVEKEPSYTGRSHTQRQRIPRISVEMFCTWSCSDCGGIGECVCTCTACSKRTQARINGLCIECDERRTPQWLETLRAAGALS